MQWRSETMPEKIEEKDQETQKEVEEAVFKIEEIRIEEISIDGICGVY
jgi:mycofactocin precursor